jgi:hypothetical protein
MLELSKRRKLEAERDGYLEYIDEVRERAEKKSDRLDDFHVAHDNIEVNEREDLKSSLRYLAKEERRIMDRINALEKQIAEEREEKQKDEPLEAAMNKASRLAVIQDLASIGINHSDLNEVTEDYNELIEEAASNDEDDTMVSEEDEKEDSGDEDFEGETEVRNE